MSAGRTSFTVWRKDNAISVVIEDGFATFRVTSIDFVDMVIEALNRAVVAGATRGVLWSGDVVDEHIAEMHEMRARTGTTWLGGRVTLLGPGKLGPEFRIDWDSLPTITE